MQVSTKTTRIPPHTSLTFPVFLRACILLKQHEGHMWDWNASNAICGSMTIFYVSRSGRAERGQCTPLHCEDTLLGVQRGWCAITVYGWCFFALRVQGIHRCARTYFAPSLRVEGYRSWLCIYHVETVFCLIHRIMSSSHATVNSNSMKVHRSHQNLRINFLANLTIQPAILSSVLCLDNTKQVPQKKTLTRLCWKPQFQLW